ncbi:NADH-quinone oxidoreductase subunit N [Rudanella lutea]|uniref:NADH-quinone oxidoreductase subunit N n=1 Tax=Rudanella lutea TaxID=451374 RepID=UPI00036C6075|nr:NADH-quinone oxidoreductase subunit N [Rudanella lutea]
MSLIDQLQDILNSLGGFGPVLWLCLAFSAGLVLDLVMSYRVGAVQTRRWVAGFTALSLLVAAGWTLLTPVRGYLFLHLLFLDNQAVFIQVVVALTGALVIAYDAFTRTPTPEAPYSPLHHLLMGLIIGLFLLSTSVNLLAIYLSLELVSISSYLLTALSRTRRASEGGIKYMLFGAISSAVMLYGMSFLYGLTGTLEITSTVFTVELAKNSGFVIAVASLLTLSGFLFKLSLVPFHVWTPDAYDAAPLPVAAFFSIAPKAGALLALMRLLTALPVGQFVDIQTPLAVVALASITLGNLSALWQTDAKRLLAYSTIAHAGFLLVGVVALSEAGFEAAFFYMATYLPINLAAFFLIDLLARHHGGNLQIGQLAGLGARLPVLSIALTVVMLALVGLPPTVGFTAKLLAFSALYNAYETTGNGWLLALFAVGLLNAVISLAYYLKIPFLLFFRPSQDSSVIKPLPQTAVWLAVSLAALVVILFINPDRLLNLIAVF